MNRNRLLKILLLPGLLVTFGVAALLVIVRTERRPEIPLQSLLLTNNEFPSSWYTGLETVSLEWKIWDDQSSLGSNNAFYSESNLGRVWANTDDTDSLPSQFIEEHVYYYNTPLEARIRYSLARPEIAYRDDWPNFTFEYNKGNRYPTEWKYRSSYADQQHVVCAMGAPQSCQLWFFWARYGQYLLEIRFFAPNQGMNSTVFAQVVTQIDSYVGQKLE